MKKIFILPSVLWLITVVGCQKPAPEIKPEIIHLSRVCRVPKNQGQAESCWAYAMTGHLENRLITRNDSVSLSPWFITRKAYEEACQRAFTGKNEKISIRGMGHTFLSLAQKYGIVRQKDYPEQPQAQLREMNKELNKLLKRYQNAPDSVSVFYQKAALIMDRYMGKVPDSINSYGSHYTDPLSFYHILTENTKPVTPLTSLTDQPFNRYIPLNYPDNYEHRLFLNLPLDSLCNLTVKIIQEGGTVVWEGDISNDGFYWREGLAVWHGKTVSAEDRQSNYQKGLLHDNHAILLMGLARDSNGSLYLIGQNSWGRKNRYGGYLYMSMDYFRMWTVAIFL